MRNKLRMIRTEIKFRIFSIFSPKSARMKTSLDHLPKEKQDRIMYITQAIVDRISPEKVILYGSYATGKWKEDSYIEDGIEYEYHSDFDFLVLMKRGDKRSEAEIQEIAESRIGFRDEVSVVAHDIDYVNGKLSQGQYFFSDIQKEGVMLYDAGNISLELRKELTPAEKKEIAKEDFEIWFPKAKSFLKHAKISLADSDLRLATFFIHQCIECAYNTVILVFRGYKPKTHNLDKLRRYIKHWSPELAAVFPRDTAEEITIFNKLKQGYVDARYNKGFIISLEDVALLIARGERSVEIVEQICDQRMGSFTTQE